MDKGSKKKSKIVDSHAVVKSVLSLSAAGDEDLRNAHKEFLSTWETCDFPGKPSTFPIAAVTRQGVALAAVEARLVARLLTLTEEHDSLAEIVRQAANIAIKELSSGADTERRRQLVLDDEATLADKVAGLSPVLPFLRALGTLLGVDVADQDHWQKFQTSTASKKDDHSELDRWKALVANDVDAHNTDQVGKVESYFDRAKELNARFKKWRFLTYRPRTTEERALSKHGNTPAYVAYLVKKWAAYTRQRFGSEPLSPKDEDILVFTQNHLLQRLSESDAKPEDRQAHVRERIRLILEHILRE